MIEEGGRNGWIPAFAGMTKRKKECKTGAVRYSPPLSPSQTNTLFIFNIYLFERGNYYKRGLAPPLAGFLPDP
jgi:hypothetical protein